MAQSWVWAWRTFCEAVEFEAEESSLRHEVLGALVALRTVARSEPFCPAHLPHLISRLGHGRVAFAKVRHFHEASDAIKNEDSRHV